MKKNSETLAELLKLRKNGLLTPEVVVNAAEPVSSPLHPHFEWDDSKAGHQYRLEQARQLIRVQVTVLENYNEPIRAFASLSSDRSYGRGYRVTTEILGDEQYRQQMLEDALVAMEAFQRRYARLKELVEVFAAMRAARRKIKEK
jgi:hypothetical protein